MFDIFKLNINLTSEEKKKKKKKKKRILLVIWIISVVIPVVISVNGLSVVKIS